MRTHTRTHGQALVEFALAATMIFFLLSAAIDLGLIFLTQQALTNASEEGASYGSIHRLVDSSVSPAIVTINSAEIRKRVRHEAGVREDGGKKIGGMRAINLLDLNANGVDDETESGVLGNMIHARLVEDNDINAASCSGDIDGCYLLVVVYADYKPFFALAPVLGNQVRVRGYTIRQMTNGS